jgi:multimeric flavodoxin WrbA
MNVLAIVGSPRKGKATDTLVDRAIDGVRARAPRAGIKKINLVDYDIRFCRNCLTCRDSRTEGPMARCSIRDDMDQIYLDVLHSDALIFGTPVHAGYSTALMSTFLERITWPFCTPDRRILTIKECPLPRSDKKRKAAIIVTSGIIPPYYRKLCDWATGHVKGIARDSLNARTVGDFYAGDIEHRGVEYYFGKAFKLGTRLV